MPVTDPFAASALLSTAADPLALSHAAAANNSNSNYPTYSGHNITSSPPPSSSSQSPSLAAGQSGINSEVLFPDQFYRLNRLRDSGVDPMNNKPGIANTYNNNSAISNDAYYSNNNNSKYNSNYYANEGNANTVHPSQQQPQPQPQPQQPQQPQQQISPQLSRQYVRTAAPLPPPPSPWQKHSAPYPSAENMQYTVTFYHNSDTGVSQYEEPPEFTRWEAARTAWERAV
eukprot:CAMPEP_0175053388 /NCGR_PEP_ID=MMETSP0052_2-20121109/8895_1 /TAXON_ID=51329 ORGANISM="Polytomella parva, Strain SAG 63-3" /NCGR_SAMPLE_ID=MMETSP0052_2 /ASSEMBLY_ACC=CAM_ASM_000194 /LENGTH=228 /DNA_ID=CAMNT_0016317913 /DNA_START=135 /DNA_END=817 /DNA_ORIENTATION=+